METINLVYWRREIMEMTQSSRVIDKNMMTILLAIGRTFGIGPEPGQSMGKIFSSVFINLVSERALQS